MVWKNHFQFWLQGDVHTLALKYPLQQGRKPRHRSARNIVDEIEYWKNKLNIRMFIFRDPVFSINKKHTIEFCNELISRKLNIRFVIETHFTSELIKKLKKQA